MRAQPAAPDGLEGAQHTSQRVMRLFRSLFCLAVFCLFRSSATVSVGVSYVWPRTLLPPVWPGEAAGLDAAALTPYTAGSQGAGVLGYIRGIPPSDWGRGHVSSV